MLTATDKKLKLSDFEYHLPEHLIAQEPAAQRDQSRLMTLQRSPFSLTHGYFSDLDQSLLPGDLLVLNDTKVMPCRLAARKPGGGKAEIFLVSERERNCWDALVKGGATTGKRLTLEQGIEAEVTESGDGAARTVRFHGIDDIRTVLPEIGMTPLPPYIRRAPSSDDRDRYQTIYASREGAVAAPTAGLHFSPELFDRLTSKGVEIAMVTLHVGPGTFQPVRVEVITEHRMLPERYEVSEETAARVNGVKSRGGRVIAVGTTSVRTIETIARDDGTIVAGQGASSLFIYPGYRFKGVDGIITNFHLPKSTLLMLISAFAGRERIFAAYRTAVSEGYRFYSYGDAMLIL